MSILSGKNFLELKLFIHCKFVPNSKKHYAIPRNASIPNEG